MKATSKSSNLSSTAQLTLTIIDTRRLGLAFERLVYTVVLNDPENYNIDEIIVKVTAVDYDNLDESIKYYIFGPFRDR